MVMSNLSSIISTGLNNPECAFFVGQMFGQYTSLKILLGMAGFIMVYKLVDNLALIPLMEKIKSLWKKRGGKNGNVGKDNEP